MSKLSCSECKFKLGNTCTWFKYFTDKEPKIIPNNILNKGCELFCDHPLLLEAIRIFK